MISYLGVPAGIIIGLMRGRAYDAVALERLVRGLRARPGPAQLREVMAQALQDPTLQITYWLQEAGSYAGADGLARFAPGAIAPGRSRGCRRGRASRRGADA